MNRDRHIPDLVSKAEAADMLVLTHQAVQQMATAGRIPAARAGTTWVFRRVVIERLAAERKGKSGDGPPSGNQAGQEEGQASGRASSPTQSDLPS